LEEATSLFFPGGISSRGWVEEFNFDLCDFLDKSLPPDVTVG
jgi:hypothetical protein